MATPLIINFCPTGMVPTKTMTPHVPITVNEIVEQTHEAYELGITIAHLHARDEAGVPTYNPEKYHKIVSGVRKNCPELVICLSTSGRNFPEFEKRSAVIELEPDMCSLTLSSLNFVQHASVNAPDMIVRLAEKMKKFGVNPELECFDLGMINFGKYLVRKRIIEGPAYWNLIFGNIAGMQADLISLATSVVQIPNTDHIAFGGLGQQQLSTTAAAIALGYGVRIGLEDNIWADQQKTQLATNIGFVRRVHQLMALQERELFTAKAFGESGFYNRNR